VCLVHGEPPTQHALAAALKRRYGVDVRVPCRGDTFELA
jgi:predicted metal-dependent RNase